MRSSSLLQAWEHNFLAKWWSVIWENGQFNVSQSLEISGVIWWTSYVFSQINISRGHVLADFHKPSTFVQLYGGEQWVRRTGMDSNIRNTNSFRNWCMYINFLFTVSGEANFTMDHTGGFIQV